MTESTADTYETAEAARIAVEHREHMNIAERLHSPFTMC